MDGFSERAGIAILGISADFPDCLDLLTMYQFRVSVYYADLFLESFGRACEKRKTRHVYLAGNEPLCVEGFLFKILFHSRFTTSVNGLVLSRQDAPDARYVTPSFPQDQLSLK